MMKILKATGSKNLFELVNRVCDRGLGEKNEVPKTWLVKACVDELVRIEGPVAMITNEARYFACDSIAGHFIRRLLNAEASEDGQGELLYPGYERLQQRYSIVRDGRQVVVKLDAIGEEEGRAKVGELRRLAIGVTKHADELEAFLDSRFKGQRGRMV
jgi:hypothetical protein